MAPRGSEEDDDGHAISDGCFATRLSCRRGSAVAALGLAACGSSSSTSTKSASAKGSGGAGDYGHGTFTYADWGGTSDTGFRTAVGKAFTQKTGWDYQTVVPIVYAKLVSQVKSHDVQWDGMDAEGWFPYSQPEALATMDYSTLGVTKDDMLYPEFWVPQAKTIANYSTSFVIGHRSDQKKPVPQNWQESSTRVSRARG